MKVKVRPVRLRTVVAACLALWMVMLSLGSASVMAIGYDNRPSTENKLGLQVKSSILIEVESGQVLLDINSDESLPIASMTKLMTEYIVLQEIANGRIAWEDVVTAGSEVADTHPSESQIYLAVGDKHTVRDLYIAMAVGSANDATEALAVFISGSEEAFINRMNETADMMGLETAIFTSSTGIQGTTVMSARDMAKLARTILTDYPEFLEFSSIQDYKFRERDTHPMINFNYMLGTNVNKTGLKLLAYEGVDGMKTGFISESGYNFTGTVKRGDLRFISVVMDAKDINARFHETAKLYDYAYATFEKKTVLTPKTVVETLESVKIKKSVQTTIPIVTEKDITFIVRKGVEPDFKLIASELTPEEELVAPIKVGTVVGTATYQYTDSEAGTTAEQTVNLITTEEAEKAGWFRLLFRAIGEFFSGLFNGILNLF